MNIERILLLYFSTALFALFSLCAKAQFMAFYSIEHYESEIMWGDNETTEDFPGFHRLVLFPVRRVRPA